MKLFTFLPVFAVFSCGLLLSACNDEPVESSFNQSSRRDKSAAVEKASQQSRQWQQQFEAEHTLRVQAETQLNHQTQAKSWWQTAATLLAIAAVVLLGLGATLGSAARHESQKS